MEGRRRPAEEDASGMDTMEEELAAIKLANERFYRALTNLDMATMDEIWAHEEATRCIHPGWGMIEGWDVIRETWGAIFGNTSSLIVEPSDVKVRVEGSMAWVSCLETITTSGSSGGITLARATNLFVKRSTGWKMILHHASQVPAGAEQTDEDEEEPTVH